MASWSSDGSYKVDPHAFLFSLDLMQHYQVRNPERAIISHPFHGPKFGSNHNLSLLTAPFNAHGCYSRPEGPEYYTPIDETNSVLTLKKENFAIDELEVYQVVFEGAKQ
jgi:hypothetical protein